MAVLTSWLSMTPLLARGLEIPDSVAFCGIEASCFVLSKTHFTLIPAEFIHFWYRQCLQLVLVYFVILHKMIPKSIHRSMHSQENAKHGRLKRVQ